MSERGERCHYEGCGREMDMEEGRNTEGNGYQKKGMKRSGERDETKLHFCHIGGKKKEKKQGK